MALHGPIYVGENRIGYWYARRLQPIPREINTYECWVDRDNQRVWEGIVEHRFGDGAIALAAAVLAAVGPLPPPGENK